MATTELQGEPPRRRRLWPVAALVAILAIVLAVVGWPPGNGADEDGGGPLNPIAAAAERTQGQSGGRASMRMTKTAPDPAQSLTMKGTAAYDDGMERSQMTMRFRDPESGELIEMEMVTDRLVFYMRSDAFDGQLPDGAEWMSFDISAATGLEMPVPVESDPQSELEMLEEATGVKKLGKGKVRGVETTRYGGVVSVADQVANLREQGADDLASDLEATGEPARLEVWIDTEGLVRRVRIVAREPAPDGGGATTTDMRMDFFDFGFVAKVEVPDGDEVFDATSLAEDAVDS